MPGPSGPRPLPRDVDEPDERELGPEQRRRVVALRTSRELVRQTNGLKVEVDVIDMVHVARFILDGGDPWVEVRAE